MSYPFAALVGQDAIRTALLLNAVDPGLGGVVICGERGTAKSTAARALADLLPPLRVVAGCPSRCHPEAPAPGCPHCQDLDERPEAEAPAPFVDLPLGATEDRVLGTLDFERALREGRRAFQPGLLAAAHRGVLYIDEVNLLPAHLVDVLLDAAATGIHVVQREGIGASHPARFLLVGTMNAEEGELRPQLLDRFGLMAEVAAPRDPEARAEVVRRRAAFEADPEAFAARWEPEQRALRARVLAARERLPRVALDDALLTFISRLCCEVGVDGLRADIALHRAARALAALGGRETADAEDVRAAAELALPHRRRRRPSEKPGLDRQQLDESFDRARPPAEEARDPGEPNRRPEGPEAPDGTAPPEAGDDAGEGPGADSRVFDAAPTGPPRPVEVAAARPAAGGRSSRRGPSAGGHGRYTRAVPDEAPRQLAVDATLRSAARNGLDDAGRPIVRRADLHRKERTGPAGTLTLFVVDASGSMASRRRMEAVKGAVLSLLRDAYERRGRVGVIAFRGAEAEVLLPPTDRLDLAERAFRSLPTGGRTPLAHALMRAAESVRLARRSDPGAVPLVVLLTDGKGNVGLPDDPRDPWSQALDAAARLSGEGVAALVLDTDAGFVRVGRAREVADALGAEYLPLDDLTAETLALRVRQRRGAAAGRAAF